MRSRFVVPVALLAAAAVPATAQAGHKHPGPSGQKVSINATPNPVVTGDPLTIYGQLKAKDVSDRLVVVWQPRRGPEQVHGRAEDPHRRDRLLPVQPRRRHRPHEPQLVRQVGRRAQPHGPRARLRRAVPRRSGEPLGLTNHQVAFNGAVTPAGVHVGDRIYLQQQVGANGNSWKTVDRARVRANGVYTDQPPLPAPGLEDAPDPAEARQVQPADHVVPRLGGHRAGAEPAVHALRGQRPHRRGRLGQPDRHAGRVEQHRAGRSRLRARPEGRLQGGRGHVDRHVRELQFTQSPINNTVYEARSGKRHSALLFEGVRDVVSVTPDHTTTVVGGVIKFEGSVLPNKAGHMIYLEQKGDDGAFHVVQVRRVRANSSYTLTHRFHSTGTKVFRVLIPGGPGTTAASRAR